jgi:aminopeptidase-like protein
MKEIFDSLFPLDRSLTGNGVRDTLKILQEIADFDIKEVPSGEKVFDWTVPDEWNVKDAYIEFEGKKIVDFSDNNLHLVGYSTPINKVLTLEELSEHLHSLPEQPTAIPYRTSYYKKTWGFCITDKQRDELKPGKYHVVIDSEFKKGSMTYGEKILKGELPDEYIINTYSCHPSMANDNTAGMMLWAYLLKKMSGMKLKYTYRFIIAPETIGIITYLAQHTSMMLNLKGAMVITHVIGDGLWGWKSSIEGGSVLDQLAEAVLCENFDDVTNIPFDVTGSNERQLSTAGFRIPTIIIYKGGLYNNNYHTSEDKYFDEQSFKISLNLYLTLVKYLEINKPVFGKNLYCEPMLSKHGLYPTLGGNKPVKRFDTDALLWVMLYANGTPLLEISQKSGLTMATIIRAYKELKERKLVL